MVPPKLVIFDCDGVLVDSEPLSNQVIRDSLARYGLDLSLSDVMDRFVGGTIMGDMELARELGADLPDDWVAQIDGEVFSVLGEKVEIIPGVDLVLNALDAAGIGYAVGSNGPMCKMDITLGRTGLWRRFEGRIFSAHDCTAPKPAPDVYLRAANAADIDPADCVVIEDSATGARAAKAAQMRCFGFYAETSREKLHPHCDATFAAMGELSVLLGL